MARGQLPGKEWRLWGRIWCKVYKVFHTLTSLNCSPFYWLREYCGDGGYDGMGDDGGNGSGGGGSQEFIYRVYSTIYIKWIACLWLVLLFPIVISFIITVALFYFWNALVYLASLPELSFRELESEPRIATVFICSSVFVWGREGERGGHRTASLPHTGRGFIVLVVVCQSLVFATLSSCGDCLLVCLFSSSSFLYSYNSNERFCMYSV